LGGRILRGQIHSAILLDISSDGFSGFERMDYEDDFFGGVIWKRGGLDRLMRCGDATKDARLEK
jgi:hypothetical protein